MRQFAIHFIRFHSNLTVLATLLFMTLAFGQAPGLTQTLLPNQTLEREMAGAETHRYKFALKANEFFQVHVEQKGVDVALNLLDVSGKVLATMDSPNGKEGPETLSFVAEQAGSIILEVSGIDEKAGKGNYAIQREAPRTATAKDRRRVEVERLFAQGITALGATGHEEAALKQLSEAQAGWEELADDYMEKLTAQTAQQVIVNGLNSDLNELNKDLQAAGRLLGEGQKLLGKSKADSLTARAKLNEALKAFRTLNEKLNDGALVEKASRSGAVSQQILDFLLNLQFSSKRDEGLSLHEIAQTHFNLGERQEQIDCLKLALVAFDNAIKILTGSNIYGSNQKRILLMLKSIEATVLENIGGALYTLGKTEESLTYLNQALEQTRALYQETQDPQLKLKEALTLAQIGLVYFSESKNRKTGIEFFSKAIEIYRTFPDKRLEIASFLGLIGGKYSLNLDYEAALKNWDDALEIYRELDNKAGQEAVLSSKGTMYYVLDNKPKVRETFNQVLSILQSPDYTKSHKKFLPSSLFSGAGVFNELVDDIIEHARLHRIGLAYQMLEDYENAIEYYEKALAVARAQKDTGRIRSELGSIGFMHTKLEKWNKAVEYGAQALEISRSRNANEDIASDLTDGGFSLLKSGKPKEALKYQNEALALYQSVGVGEGKVFSLGYSLLLNELARTHDALGNRRLAIFYGKRAVNAMQGERQRLQNLDPVSQKGFLEKKGKHYRRLADWLIAEGRIAEAEQVLALFKQDEYFDSLLPDKQLEAIQMQSLDKILLTDAERDAFNRYEQIASQLAAVGKEHDALEKKSKNFEAGKFPEQLRLDQLSKELDDVRTAFNSFLEELDAKFRNLIANPTAQASYSRALLRRLNLPRTAIVSTIVGQDRLNLIVTTARSYRAYPIDIKATELNRLVVEFREAVKNPNADPRTAGKKLYDVLFPVGLLKDLANVKADTIVWSLDGTLRYAPIAALWDGKRYLIERYANSVITLASRDKLNQPLRPHANWTALGLGVSQEGKVRDFDGTELSFVALPAVPQELCGVINDPQKRRFCAELTKGRPGILNGRNLSDGEFTLQSLKLNFGKYPVVHIASHFRLNPGNENTSYLLLGGKNAQERKLTLAAARDELGRKFEGVELLTLSACNTAMSGGDKGNGAEVESFGALAQNWGAKTVIATLWPVNDASTRDVMIEFYREMKVNQRIGKAEALRKAQLLLLQGEYKAGKIPTWRRGLRISKVEGSQTPSFERDKKAKYAHPYFWSPFVLMGNWR